MYEMEMLADLYRSLKYKNLQFCFSLILVCFLFTGCVTNSPSHKMKITATIQSVLNQQALYWNSGDIEKYMFGYYQSDSLRFASGGTITYGWKSTLERYLNVYPDKSQMGRLTFSQIDIDVISADAALVFGRWQLERQTKDNPWGLFTLLFRKFPEGWRIVSDHTSLGSRSS
jgi:ketosteroid isomerase-like protein